MSNEKMVSEKTADYRVAEMAGIVSGWTGWCYQHESLPVALLHGLFTASLMWLAFRLIRKIVP